MSTKRYTYNGPLSAVTLNGTEVSLTPGCEVSLPDDLSYTQGLLRRGLLTLVPEKASRSATAAGPKSQAAPKTQRTPKASNSDAPAADKPKGA